MYINIESLRCTPKINRILYANYTSIKRKEKNAPVLSLSSSPTPSLWHTFDNVPLNKQPARYFPSKMGLIRNNKELQFGTCVWRQTTRRSAETKESRALRWAWEGLLQTESLRGNCKNSTHGDFSLAESWPSLIDRAATGQRGIFPSSRRGRNDVQDARYVSSGWISSMRWVTRVWVIALLLTPFSKRFPFINVYDDVDEADGWRQLTELLGHTSRIT